MICKYGLSLSFTSKRPTIFISTVASIISIVLQCTTKSAGVHWSPVCDILWHTGVCQSPLDYVGQCKVLVNIIQRPPDLIKSISPVIFCKTSKHCTKSAILYSVWKSSHETKKKLITRPDFNRSRPGMCKTNEDQDRSPVLGPSKFRICDDRWKTGLDRS